MGLSSPWGHNGQAFSVGVNSVWPAHVGRPHALYTEMDEPYTTGSDAVGVRFRVVASGLTGRGDKAMH